MSMVTPRASRRDLSSDPAPCRARSMPSIAISTECSCRSSPARRSIGSVRRAARTRFDLRVARSFANWMPKPLDAPVINDHLFLRFSISLASLAPSVERTLSVDRNVPGDLRLARQDVAIGLVLLGERILYRHAHSA